MSRTRSTRLEVNAGAHRVKAAFRLGRRQDLPPAPDAKLTYALQQQAYLVPFLSPCFCCVAGTHSLVTNQA